MWSSANSVPMVMRMMGPRTARTRSLPLIMLHLLGWISRGVGLRRAGEAHEQQVNAEQDEQHRPVLENSFQRNDVGGVQQQQHAHHDQHNRARRKARTLRVQVDQARKLVHRLPGAPFDRRVMRFESHVEHPDGDEDAKQRFDPRGRTGANDADQQSEDNRVDQTFGVLAVVNRADPRNHKAEYACQAGRNAGDGDRRPGISGCRGCRDSARGARAFGWHVLIAINCALSRSLALFAKRFAAAPAECRRGYFRMIETVHKKSPISWVLLLRPVRPGLFVQPCRVWVAAVRRYSRRAPRPHPDPAARATPANGTRADTRTSNSLETPPIAPSRAARRPQGRLRRAPD